MNKLLDNLDTNVGDVVEQQVEMYDDALYALQGGGGIGGSGGENGDGSGGSGAGIGLDGGMGGMGGIGGESSVDDILAKRGLLNDDDDDDEEEEEEESEEEDEEGEAELLNQEDNGEGVMNDENSSEGITITQQTQSENEQVSHEDNDDGGENDDNEKEVLMNENGVEETTSNDDTQDKNINADVDVDADPNADGNEELVKSQKSGNDSEDDEKDNTVTTTTSTKAKATIHKLQNLVRKNVNVNMNDTNNNNNYNQDEKDQIISNLKKQLKQQKQQFEKTKKEITNATNKETRKLRRTVVKLNAELDSAERELDAQRTELERAAVRMEKERQRYKDDKERMNLSHKEDMQTVMDEHKMSVDAMVTSHAEQMVDMEERIKRAEEARAKEGGDMSMEISESVEREREAMKKVMGLEEENTTLNSQISSLNTQITALQSRVESLQGAVEVASEQEREADDRLDAALSLHARQIGQRQAREAELERTIADIAAALVVARQREAQQVNNTTPNTDTSSEDMVELKEKLVAAEDDIEVFKAQLMLERQKSETLHKELEDISTERTQELSSTLARQKQYDRRVSDLTSEVTRLQSKLRSIDHTISSTNENGDSDDSGGGGDDNVSAAAAHFQAKENEYKKQISTLSEDLLRLRGRLENTSTEVLTLRNRLKAALNRAEIAENEAKASTARLTNNPYDMIERGPLSNNYGNKTRRRFGGRSKKSATIRSILNLDSGTTTNETQEAIGGTIDSLDMATIKTLNYMRSDPFARIFFILYLVFLHVWVFCLLAFHAHGSLEPSANIGPEQLLKHSYRHLEQVHGKP